VNCVSFVIGREAFGTRICNFLGKFSSHNFQSQRLDHSEHWI
jgi:hypothetical protein